MMGVAKNYRGCVAFGDLLIPACALNLGHGALQWGFDFQFLSSVFFVSLVLYFATVEDLAGRPRLLVGAFVALFGCAWTGLNEMIFSSFLVMLLVGYFIVERTWKRVNSGAAVYAITVIVAVTNVILWYSWSPSGASVVSDLSAEVIVRNIYGLSNASLVIFSHIWTW